MMVAERVRQSEKAGLWPTPWWLSLVWGFAEATLFFIVPDVLLCWESLGGWRRGTRALVAIIVGSLAGGLLVYGLAVIWPESMRNAIASVPFVRGAMFVTVAADFDAQGPVGMLMGPASGIPYKIYAVLAPQSFGVLSFAIFSIPARLERLALSWLIFALLGRWLAPVIARHRRATAALYALLWTGIYAYYWSRS
ncbi:MAG: hypothetical protein KDK89_00965 [Alphaproteobacteria bacterium]|nr:hypothetical protein [Alphaproteobacteria bacterium]